MNDQAWLISAVNNQFVGIIHRRNEINTHIYVGGKKKGCVILDIDHEELEATLHVGYDKKCNINGDLPNKRGTILMIKAACTFMFHMFPNVTQIVIRDTSATPRMQLFLYGKTWYQRHFDAQPDGCHAKLAAFLDVIKTKPEFSQIWEIICDTIPRRKRNQVKLELSKVYENANSLSNWVQKLIRDVGADRDCEILDPWLFTLFNVLSNNLPINEMEWIIEKDKTYVEIECEELDTIEGLKWTPKCTP